MENTKKYSMGEIVSALRKEYLRKEVILDQMVKFINLPKKDTYQYSISVSEYGYTLDREIRSQRGLHYLLETFGVPKIMMMSNIIKNDNGDYILSNDDLKNIYITDQEQFNKLTDSLTSSLFINNCFNTIESDDSNYILTLDAETMTLSDKEGKNYWKYYSKLDYSRDGAFYTYKDNDWHDIKVSEDKLSNWMLLVLRNYLENDLSPEEESKKIIMTENLSLSKEIKYKDLWRDICLFEVYQDIISYDNYITYLTEKYGHTTESLLKSIELVKKIAHDNINKHHEKEQNVSLVLKTECFEEKVKTMIERTRLNKDIYSDLFDAKNDTNKKGISVPNTDFMKNITVVEDDCTEEYKKLQDEADRRIEEGRKREAKLWNAAKDYIVGLERVNEQEPTKSLVTIEEDKNVILESEMMNARLDLIINRINSHIMKCDERIKIYDDKKDLFNYLEYLETKPIIRDIPSFTLLCGIAGSISLKKGIPLYGYAIEAVVCALLSELLTKYEILITIFDQSFFEFAFSPISCHYYEKSDALKDYKKYLLSKKDKINILQEQIEELKKGIGTAMDLLEETKKMELECENINDKITERKLVKICRKRNRIDLDTPMGELEKEMEKKRNQPIDNFFDFK